MLVRDYLPQKDFLLQLVQGCNAFWGGFTHELFAKNMKKAKSNTGRTWTIRPAVALVFVTGSTS